MNNTSAGLVTAASVGLKAKKKWWTEDDLHARPLVCSLSMHSLRNERATAVPPALKTAKYALM